jgi:hypothetical protein
VLHYVFGAIGDLTIIVSWFMKIIKSILKRMKMTIIEWFMPLWVNVHVLSINNSMTFK